MANDNEYPTGVRDRLARLGDPSASDDQMIAASYLAGRADMIADLYRGMQAHERPTITLARASRQDADLAARFGIEAPWGLGCTPEAAANATLPSVREMLRLRRVLARRQGRHA